MDSAPSLSLEGELYEIINSRHEIRGMNVIAVLISSLDHLSLFPSFQYGVIPKTLKQEQYRFLNPRKGSHHSSRLINAGLKGEAWEVLPALFTFQC